MTDVSIRAEEHHYAPDGATACGFPEVALQFIGTPDRGHMKATPKSSTSTLSLTGCRRFQA